MATGKYSLADAKPIGKYSLADVAPSPESVSVKVTSGDTVIPPPVQEQPKEPDPGFWQGLKETTVGPIKDVWDLQQKNAQEHGSWGGAVKTYYDIAKGLLTVPPDQVAKIKESVKNGDVMSFIQHLPSLLGGGGAAMVRPSELAQEGKWGEAAGQTTGLVGGAVLGAKLPKLIKGTGNVAKTVASEVLGKTTGVGSKVLTQAMEKPTGQLTEAMRGGVSELDVVSNFKDALQNVKKARSESYQQQLSKLPMAGKVEIDIAPVRQSFQDNLDRFGVKTDHAGNLDFSESTLVDASAQNQVKAIHKMLTRKPTGPQGQNLILSKTSEQPWTPAEVDALKRKVDDLYSPTSPARAVVQSVKASARDLLNDQVPGYKQMTGGYAKASQFLDQLSDLSLESKNPGTAVRKLTTLLNQNNGYRQILAEKLSQYTVNDLEGQLAGLNLSKWAPRGIMGPASGAGLIYQVATHAIHPMVAVGMAMTSPRLMGELLTAIAKIKQIPAIPGLPEAIKIGGIVRPDIAAAEAAKQ
jgi:hypothetical protein